jgi:iron complex transport system ATP-binding protein
VIRLTGAQVALGGQPVLRGVDLQVDDGEWVAVVGPNGAGKSTLLRLLAGLAPGDAELVLDGRVAASLRRRERALLVALVVQTPTIPDGITVADYVLLGRTPHIGAFGVEGPSDLAAVHDALASLDLLGFAGRIVSTLSGGERQRVLLARALAQGAPILLLDEPTSALDVGHQQQVLELVDGLRRERGLTVVTTMHDLTLAGQYADRLVLLHEGEVVVSGPADEVLTEEHLRRFYGAKVRIVDDGGRPVVLPQREATGRAPAPPP